jgi:hypothetical protein
MYPVRSYAVALFLIAKGFKPIGVNTQGIEPEFQFEEDAREGLEAYRVAKSHLGALVARQQQAGR